MPWRSRPSRGTGQHARPWASATAVGEPQERAQGIANQRGCQATPRPRNHLGCAPREVAVILSFGPSHSHAGDHRGALQTIHGDASVNFPGTHLLSAMRRDIVWNARVWQASVLSVHDCACCPPHSDGGRCVPLAPCAVKGWMARRSQ
eukprot:8613485-Pyramimonas_sp.AAC.2